MRAVEEAGRAGRRARPWCDGVCALDTDLHALVDEGLYGLLRQVVVQPEQLWLAERLGGQAGRRMRGGGDRGACTRACRPTDEVISFSSAKLRESRPNGCAPNRTRRTHAYPHSAMHGHCLPSARRWAYGGLQLRSNCYTA